MSDTETTSSIINSFETLKYYVLYFQVCTRAGHCIVCTDFHTGWALYYIYRLALEVGIILLWADQKGKLLEAGCTEAEDM